MAYIELQTATILAGQALSNQVGLGEKTLVGIVIPASWATANLTFQASVDGSNFYELYNASGSEVTVDAEASVFIAIDPTQWRGITSLIVRSGTSGSPVNQTDQMALTLVTRTVY